MEISIDYQGKIGKNYSIIRFLEGGGFGEVYLVKDINTNIEYAAKVIDSDDMFNNEAQINEIVNEIKTSNIVKYISKGKETIEYLGKFETKNYIILEYCEYGDLFDYKPLDGFEEKKAKIIFKTILETVEKIHNKGVCHLDLKLENILVDKDFNLKISDFGLSKEINKSNKGIFEGSCGTSYYKAPQMNLKLNYNGIKADIFSLGVMLYILIIGDMCFYKASLSDEVYAYLVENNKIEVLEELKGIFPINATEESRQIFLDMISLKEKDRPEIKDILNNKWFEDIKDLSDEDKRKAIKEIIEKKINEKNKNQNKSIKPKSKDKKNESKCLNKLFDNKATKIKILKKKIKFDNYLQINGNLNPIDFMNEFANKMDDIYDDVEADNNNYLNFNIIIKKKEEEKEKEKEKINVKEKINIKEKINNLTLGNIDKLEKDLKIQVELIKINDKEYLLNFIKVKGALRDYYQKIKVIMSDAEALILGK